MLVQFGNNNKIQNHRFSRKFHRKKSGKSASFVQLKNRVPTQVVVFSGTIKPGYKTREEDHMSVWFLS